MPFVSLRDSTDSFVTVATKEAPFFNLTRTSAFTALIGDDGLTGDHQTIGLIPGQGILGRDQLADRDLTAIGGDRVQGFDLATGAEPADPGAERGLRRPVP